MKRKKFAEGGGIEDIGGDEIASARADMDRESDIKESARAVPKMQGSFKEEFAKARAKGDANFKWNGKLYNTKVADSKPAAPKPAAKPSDSGPARQTAVSSAMARMGFGRGKPEAGPLERKVASSPRGGVMSRLEVNEATGKRSKYDTDTSTPAERMFKRAAAATPKGRLYAKGGRVIAASPPVKNPSSGVTASPNQPTKYPWENLPKMAAGGAVAKPYKPSAGDLNEKSGGDQEMENRELMRKKAKPAPAPKPKMYARGGGIEAKGKTRGKFV